MLVAEDLLGARALAGVAKVAPHPPRDPQQQQAADQDQADDLHQLGDDQREGDAQHQRREDADQDDLPALLGGQAGGERTDDDRIVAGEHEVDHQHLEEGGEGRRLGDVREVRDDRIPDVGGPAEAGRGPVGGGGNQQLEHSVISLLL